MAAPRTTNAIGKKPGIIRAHHTIDATGIALGRLATQIATLLQGKNKPTFQRHIDAGDFVKIQNAEQIKITGKKLTQKVYRHYSGFPGGLKEKQLKDALAGSPAWVIRRAVWNMLPKNKLRDQMIKRLTVTN